MDIVEYMREQAIKNLFSMNLFNSSFNQWKSKIESKTGKSPDFHALFNLGDKLSEIFKTTGQSGRSQASVSGGGSTWEGLVCWYLNLCLIGSRTVVIKQSKNLIPKPIADAITVNYGSFTSNTESDLVAITFPNEGEFSQDITTFSQEGSFNYQKTIEQLCKKHFNNLEVGIIQCKTNWNDNAQIPMLWQIVYSASGFQNANITIGKNGFSMKDFSKFTYSFVTVPSGDRQVYAKSVLPVKRVQHLSGGNYWGRDSVSGIAHSIKEMFAKNFSGWRLGSHKRDVDGALQHKQNFSYFNLSL